LNFTRNKDFFFQKLKNELNGVLKENAKKANFLQILHKTQEKNNEKTVIFSRRSFSETGNSNFFQSKSDEPDLLQKLVFLQDKIEKIEGNIIFCGNSKESLVHKREELKQMVLEYKKKIDDLGYLKGIAQKKFSNIESISFKAKESKVKEIFFLFSKRFSLEKQRK